MLKSEEIKQKTDVSDPMMKITVTENGPYEVSGDVPLSMQLITPNKEGISWEWKEAKPFKTPALQYRLCRCGQSKNKPFCDGTHAKISFQGKLAASRRPYIRQVETERGPSLTLTDAESLCAFARFCDAGKRIWNEVQEDTPESKNLTVRMANHCPAGRLVAWDNKTGKAIEHHLQKSIGVIEDLGLGVSGPLWVRGGILIESQDGKRYEVRNRVTLCRCGTSNNMPFCNGSHASIQFNDGLVEFVPADSEG